MIWAVVFGAGVFAGVFAVCNRLFEKIGKKDWMAEIRKMQKIREIGLSDSLQKWILQAEKGIGKNSVFYSGNKGALLIAIPCSIAGFWFGLACFHTLIAAMLLALIGVLIPEQIAYNRARAQREQVMEQMGIAVRMFAAEYAETPNTVRAINVIAKRLPEPIGGIFRQADRDFSSGKDTNQVLINFSRKLSFEYGRLFVQLLRLSIEDSAVEPMFMQLAERLSSQQKLIRKSRVDVAVDRGLAVALNLAVIPAYIFTIRKIPNSAEFLVNTAAGRAIITLCLLTVIVGIVLDRILSQGGEAI